MSENGKLITGNGRNVVAKATITAYSTGQVEFSKTIDNPNIAWAAVLFTMAMQLNEARLSELASAVNQLMAQSTGAMSIQGIDLAKVLKKQP